MNARPVGAAQQRFTGAMFAPDIRLEHRRSTHTGAWGAYGLAINDYERRRGWRSQT
jgi:hypothetical protein